MIEVRKKIASDADAVTSIITTATNELRSVYRPKRAKEKSVVEESAGVVATIGNNVVGSAEYIVNTDNILVRGLAVSPAHRNQGVASAIVEYLVLESQKKGRSKIVLSTIKETGAFNAFLRMGFTITSESVSEIFEGTQNEPVTLISMSRAWHNESPG